MTPGLRLHAKMANKRAQDIKRRTEITFAERCAIERLARCTFTPGSAHKRFARNMREMLDAENAADRSSIMPTPMLTDGQRDQLWRLVYRYRRQIWKQEHLKDAQLAGVGSGDGDTPYTVIHQPINQVHIKELVNIARLYDDRMGLRRRVAAFRATAQEQM